MARRFAVIALAFAAAARAGEPDAAALAFFESKVRPVLVEKCHKCHGEQKQQGSLRLDSREAMLTGGDTGPALVPGDPAKSLIVQALSHTGELKMPPSGKLPAEPVADIKKWVELGAPWPASAKPAVAGGVRKGTFQITDKDRQHWAFQPVKRPTPPTVKAAGWVTNPIDAFILAKLEGKGLRPNPPASPRELIRRVTYDLTGLPPTPEDVEAFAADPSPEAFRRLVDKLLDSPRYGEKWGRHWLDLVRYAETNSYERDNPKPNVWRYRDYVIRALNADKPYDRFLKEQLAGDELLDGGPDGLIATGFYRLGIWDDEPSDRELARYDGLDDIVATTGQTMLGLTVDCARCHDHKIDPIAQRDYYRLVSFFQGVNHYRNGGPMDEKPLFATEADRDAYTAKIRDLERRRDAAQAAVTELEREFRTKSAVPNERVTDIDELKYRYYRDSWAKLPDFDSLKPEDTGELKRGLFDIGPRTRDTAFGFVFEGTLIVPADGRYTFYLDSDDGSRLTVGGKVVLTYDGIHGIGREKSTTVELTKGRTPIRLDYFQNQNGFGLAVDWRGPGFDRRELSHPVDDRPKGASPEPKALAKAIARDGARVLGADKAAKYQRARMELNRLLREQPAVDRALCVTEGGRQPADTFVLIRGMPAAKGERVEPAFPTVLGGMPAVVPEPAQDATTSGRRLALANWIASKDNPLTARVMANRVWQQHFGRGIVRTPSDYGYQGAAPTHPELLDWLASEFVANGWSLKQLHRTILLSSAYRMSSRGSADALAADPANDLFWRMDMRRLTAEEVRDSMLACSGAINLQMFGPSVYPEIAKEVLAGQSKPGYGWHTSAPEQQARRSIYVHVKRSLLLPILESFDAAETDRTNPARFASTQPTQALGMINGAFAKQQAKALADRAKREAGDDMVAQTKRILALTAQRPPTDAEVARGVTLARAMGVESLALVALNTNEFMYLD